MSTYQTESDEFSDLLEKNTPDVKEQEKTKSTYLSYRGIFAVVLCVVLTFVALTTPSFNNISSSLTQLFTDSEIDYEITIQVASPEYGTISSVSLLPWDGIAEPYKDQVYTITSFTINGEDYTSDLVNPDNDYVVTWTIDDVDFVGLNPAIKLSGTGLYDLTVSISVPATSKYSGLLLKSAKSQTSKKQQIRGTQKAISAKPRYSTAYECSFSIAAKYIRREIRTLSEGDRVKYLEAAKLLYTLSEEEGQALYGPKYHSAETYAIKHLRYAGTNDCDHWHDNAAIAVIHIAFILEYEQTLQAIDPTMALPYWEYSYDKYLYDSPVDSIMFSEDWFGDISNANGDHSIPSGRFADVTVPSGDNYQEWDIVSTKSFNPYVNAYNQIRAPWNQNPNAKLGRYNLTNGYESFTTFPGCDVFQLASETTTLSDLNYYLNGLTHGPTHILIGGLWDSLPVDTTYSYAYIAWRVLMFKVLWRRGYARCPTSCSADESCLCYIPQEYIDEYGALGILEKAELTTVFEGYGEISTPLSDYTDEFWLGLLKVLEQPGMAGEMFSSNAAYDPTFWPMHGTLDRLLGLKRVLKSQGVLSFDETWGFPAFSNSSGDVYLPGACDWSGVSGMSDLTLPTCEADAYCYAQEASDTMAFSNFLNLGETYTNQEFYDFLHPWNDEVPYVYDTLTYDFCTEVGYPILTSAVESLNGLYSGYASESLKVDANKPKYHFSK